MIEKCFDEGTIQAFLDGELDLEAVEQVTGHLALCDDCTRLVAEAEAEMAFTSSAFDQGFNELVPTQRLWTKINNSIEAEKQSRSVWASVLEYLTSPTAVAFASLLIVFGLFAGLLSFKSGTDLADGSIPRVVDAPVSEIASLGNPTMTSDPGLINNVDVPEEETVIPPEVQPAKPEFGPVQTDLSDQTRTTRPVREKARPEKVQPERVRPDIAVAQPVAAEESYIRTITTLERTVGETKDQVLRPSDRFAFERDLAVANATIDKLRREIRDNPNNEAARELLRSSYQNKIDLLNSVAEKSELMASVY